jgi:cytochrome c5
MRIFVVAALALSLISAAAPKPAKPIKLPKGAGKAMVQAKCSQCHALSVALGIRQDKEHWAATVDQMISRGAIVSDDEFDVVVAYLAKNFGPKK